MGSLSLTSDLSSLRGDMVCMIGIVGKYQLHHLQEHVTMETFTVSKGGKMYVYVSYMIRV